MLYPYLLQIVLPILLGALIGYVTNAIAIRMLFRPFTEYRIGPFRVPFTPGVIPRQRHQLSRSIARMVSRELLTEGAFRKRLEDPVFQNRMYERLSDLSDRLFTTPIGKLLDAVPLPVREIGVSFLRRAVREAFMGREGEAVPLENSLSKTPLPKPPFRNLWEEALESVWEIPVPASVPREILRRFQESEGTRRFIHRVRRAVQEKVQEGVTLKELLGGDFRSDRIRSILDPIYPKASSFLIEFLRTPEVKKQLEIEGRFLLRDIFSELSFFQRLLITAGQYDRALEERMPYIVEDVIQAIERLKDEVLVKEKILHGIEEELEKLLEQPVMILYEKAGKGWIDGVWAILQEGIEKGLVQILQSILLSRGEADVPLGIWVSQLSGIPRGELTPRTLELIRAWFFPEAGAGKPSTSLSPTGEGLVSVFRRMWEVPQKVVGEKTVGDLFPLGREEKSNLDLFLIRTLFDILSAKLPVILKALDIEDLVAKRIDELDIREVEELLLSVISRHLTWINVFGGILGAVIGALQVFVQYIK